jgi:hypothetical protein
VSVELARRVADAVLYEGYVLYPYRASAAKNRSRFQFGVVVPRAIGERLPWTSDGVGGAEEGWFQRTECLLETAGPFRVRATVRFLQTQARTVQVLRDGRYRRTARLEVGDAVLVPWDEAVEREVQVSLACDGDLGAEQVRFELPGGRATEPVTDPEGRPVGRLVRRRWRLLGRTWLRAERIPGPYRLVRLRVHTENLTPWSGPTGRREEVLRRSFLAAHTLLEVEGGRFLSALDPPPFAREEAARCVNVRTFPVLVGDEGAGRVMLSAPIVLYDHPEIAPESPGETFDATEIDELLALRTLTLTDEEKREARGTDPRAAAIVDRADVLPPEIWERLHGAIRGIRVLGEAGEARLGAAEQIADASIGRAGSNGRTPPEAPPPWWDPGEDASVSPETDSVLVDSVRVARGSRVLLRPGRRRADAQDMFLEGRVGTVEAIFSDVEGRSYLAVSVEDDPAAELHRWHGRYLYFAPDEVEPLGGSP